MWSSFLEVPFSAASNSLDCAVSVPLSEPTEQVVMFWTTLPILPFFLALCLSVNGAKSRKLSPSGAVTAFVVGFVIMSTHVRAIGISLVVFYLLASRATKRKSSQLHNTDGLTSMRRGQAAQSSARSRAPQFWLPYWMAGYFQ